MNPQSGLTPAPGRVECPFCGLYNEPTAVRCKCGKGLSFSARPSFPHIRTEIDYLRSIDNSLSTIKFLLSGILVFAIVIGIVYVIARFPALYR